MSSIKTVMLSGSELKVDGLAGQNTIIRNLGSSAVYASVSPSVKADSDGVIEIPAGGGVNLYGTNGTVYLLGDGKLMPFKDGIYSYFDSDSYDGGNIWADEMGMSDIEIRGGSVVVGAFVADASDWNDNVIKKNWLQLNQISGYGKYNSPDMPLIWYAIACSEGSYIYGAALIVSKGCSNENETLWFGTNVYSTTSSWTPRPYFTGSNLNIIVRDKESYKFTPIVYCLKYDHSPCSNDDFNVECYVNEIKVSSIHTRSLDIPELCF